MIWDCLMVMLLSLIFISGYFLGALSCLNKYEQKFEDLEFENQALRAALNDPRSDES